MKRFLLSISILSVFSCKSVSSQSSLKVVGGLAAEPGSFSSVVKIGSCSAVRVSEDGYLTAKHCVSENGWQKGREISISLNYKDKEELNFKGSIAKVFEHSEEDVALLRLELPDVPIAMALINKNTSGTRLTITGYGCNELYVAGGRSYPGRGLGYLQTAKVNLFRGSNQSYSPDRYLYVKGLGETMLGDTRVTGPSLCPGDSGGGLFSEDEKGIQRLWGINSSIHLYSLVSTFVRIDPEADQDVFEWLQESLDAET